TRFILSRSTWFVHLRVIHYLAVCSVYCLMPMMENQRRKPESLEVTKYERLSTVDQDSSEELLGQNLPSSPKSWSFKKLSAFFGSEKGDQDKRNRPQ
ncbi:hypothetical protein BIW11_09566, partial [Tropilaelaps mercedesae]